MPSHSNAARIPAKATDGAPTERYRTVTNPKPDKRASDPRATIADQMAAQLAASDKAYAKRAAAAARLDAELARSTEAGRDEFPAVAA